ncbi:MAG: BON domain-containing protein [Pirellulaceae bacterium]|nr:BON domain-containing protein [Pirellulaceae bacterium]
MRRFLVGTAILAVALAAPCRAPADDQAIAQHIAQQLRTQKEQGKLKGFGIDLQVDQGTVWLSGEVASAEQRDLALDIARRAGGVKQVINDLVISDAVAAVAASQNSANGADAGRHEAAQPAPSANVSDDDLARDIMSQLKELKAAGKLRGFSLEVKPQNGQIWMVGRVASEQQKQLVLNTAASVPGVRQVVDALRVETATASTATAKATPAPRQAAAQPRTSTPADSQSNAKRGLLSGLWSPNSKPAKVEPARPRTAAPRPAQKPADNLGNQSAASDTHTPAASAAASFTNRRSQADVAARAERTTEVLQVAAERFEANEHEAHPAADEPAAESTSILHKPPVAVGSGVPSYEVSAAALMSSQVAMAPAPQMAPQQPVRHLAPVPFAASQLGQPAMVASNPNGVPAMPISQPLGGGGFAAPPVPMHSAGPGYGVAPARYDHPYLPGYAWPSYAPYPNYAAVTYPRQYSPSAWPYIGPFYPYPQVPLGWRKVTLEWDDGWWMLDFKSK